MKDLAEYIESSRPFKNLFSCSVQPESSYNEKPNEESQSETTSKLSGELFN